MADLLRVLMIVVSLALFAAETRASGAQDAKSLDALRAAAEKGSAQAQLDYAKAIKSPSEARVWAEKAAGQGLAEAWYWLGQNTAGDTAPFYEKAAEKGHPDAFPYLLDELLFRAGSRADVVKAKRFGDLARKLRIDLGYDSAKSLTTIDRCFEAGAPEIPASDRPTDAESASFRAVKDCLLIKAGVGEKPDAQKYGRCLLSRDPTDNNSLAEIYANGWGVKRNPRLALALVCHASEVPAELIGMVETLYTTRNQARLDNEFLFCDHVTSGMNQGNCTAREEEMAAARREAASATLLVTWPDTHKAAFVKLQEAAEAFFTSHSRTELDMSGTARAAIAISEEASLRDELLENIRGFEAGKLPVGISYKAADAELNAVYSEIMKRKELEAGTVTKEGIRATQRKWLVYRDAWAAFGAARYPKLAADGWRAWATSKRAAQLKELLQP